MTAPDFPALVAQARARMDETERLAKVATPGPWEHSGLDQVTHEPEARCLLAQAWHGRRDAGHIAAWSPDVALRMVAWGRDVLDRHADLGHEPCVTGYWESTKNGRRWIGEPCADARAVLTAWGVTE